MVSIKLLIVDLCGELVQNLGTYSEKDIQKLIEIALDKNLQCLSFIDVDQDTFFSEKQLLSIKKEIQELESNCDVNKKLLKEVQKGIEIALEEGYLKFEPIRVIL